MILHHGPMIQKILSLTLIAGFVTGLTTSCASMRKPEPTPIVELHTDSSWRCTHESPTTTTCRPTMPPADLEKAIIWTAKQAGPEDTMDQYRERMGRVIKQKVHFRELISKPVSNEVVAINGQDWVDAVQINSEIRNFNTRYLATVKNGVAILVTFTARKEVFADFQKEIQPIVDQLKVNN